MAATALLATLFGGGKVPSPKAPVVPPAPSAADEAARAEATLSARKAKPQIPGTPSGSAATLLTGPSGLAPAATQSKTLLGL